ncbi:hypothetical protein Q9233_002191 [Columba guinea]|nr:hypothetical protein Q9233_002191 [Columba guinea]
MCSGGTLSILRSDSYAELSQYRDQHFRGTRYDQERLLRKSCTLYVGNLSFYTTEEQIHELFSKSGDIKKVIMGLDKVKKTACGFCFVESEMNIGKTMMLEEVAMAKSFNANERLVSLAGELKLRCKCHKARIPLQVVAFVKDIIYLDKLVDLLTYDELRT